MRVVSSLVLDPLFVIGSVIRELTLQLVLQLVLHANQGHMGTMIISLAVICALLDITSLLQVRHHV